MAACTSEVERVAVRLVEAKDGVMHDAVGGPVEGVTAGPDGFAERPAIQAPGASLGRARCDADRAHPIAGDAAQRRVAGRQRLF